MTTAPVTFDHSVPFGAIWTSFTLTLWNLLRIKRLLALLILFLVPLFILTTFRIAKVYERERVQRLSVERPEIVRHIRSSPEADTKDFLQVEFVAIFIIIANVAAPLTILLFATGMIRDEQENQTLTYLLVRPIPKWAIYLTKLIAAILVAWVMTIVGIALALATLWIGSGQPPAEASVTRFLTTLAPFGLLIAANGAVFAVFSVFFKRSLVIGAVYIALFEGFLANFPFVLRNFTNLHYFQCLVINQMSEHYKPYDIRPRQDPIMVWPLAREVVPESQEAIITLLSVFVIAALIGMYVFTIREFRMKTPESGGI
jgi:ABC-2 type transport system permease protein